MNEDRMNNPLDTLVSIYGEKFKKALESGNFEKARNMCNNYQSPDIGRQLPTYKAMRAFAYRMSMEFLHSNVSGEIIIKYDRKDFSNLYSDFMVSKDGMFRLMDDFEHGKMFKLFGVTFVRRDD